MVLYVVIGIAVGLILYLLTDWLLASVLLGAAIAISLVTRDLAG